MDDGSDDRSLDILYGLARKNSKLRVCRHEGGINRGPGPSRNLGLSMVSTEFVSFLDSDDYYLDKRFEETIDYFEKNKLLDGVYESIRILKESTMAQHYPLEEYAVSRVVEPKEALESIILNTYGSVQISGFTYRTDFLRSNKIQCTEHKRGQELNIIYMSCIYGKVKLFPSQYKVVRRLHESNAIWNAEQGYLSKTARFQNWYEFILNNKLPVKVNRYFFKNYIHYHKELNGVKRKPSRKIIQAKQVARSFFKNPKLLLKLF